MAAYRTIQPSAGHTGCTEIELHLRPLAVRIELLQRQGRQARHGAVQRQGAADDVAQPVVQHHLFCFVQVQAPGFALKQLLPGQLHGGSAVRMRQRPALLRLPFQ